MKDQLYVGNTSQSVIPVPNFFFTRKLNNIDTFDNTDAKRKSYFVEKDLFNRTKDINLNRNIRNMDKAFESYNTRRILPKIKKEAKVISTTLSANDLGLNIKIPKEFYDFEKFNQFLEKVNPTEKLKLKREEILRGINNIVENIPTASYNETNFNFNARNSRETHGLTFNTLNSTLKSKIQYSKVEPESDKFQSTIMSKIQVLNQSNNFLRTKSLGNLNIPTLSRMNETQFQIKKTKVIENIATDIGRQSMYNSTGIVFKNETDVMASMTNQISTSDYNKTILNRNKSFDFTKFHLLHKKPKKDENDIDTDRYNSRPQKYNYPAKKSIIHEPFLS